MNVVRPPKIPDSVLVVIHTHDFQVLLIERADRPGFWQSVTGSKDAPDEAERDTALREVAEETGIVIGSAQVPKSNLRDWNLRNVYEIYATWRHRYAPGVTHNTEYVFGLLAHANAMQAACVSEPDERVIPAAIQGRPQSVQGVPRLGQLQQ